MKCSLGISNFLEEISSLSHSVIFLYFFTLIAEEGFLAILWNSFQMGISFSLLPLASLLFSAICKASSDNHFAFFSWGCSWALPPVPFHGLLSIVLQALWLSDLIPLIYFPLPLYDGFCWLYRASPSSAAKIIINLISVLSIWWCPCVESSLVLLEEGVCYDQWVLLTKLRFCHVSFCIPRPNLPVHPGISWLSPFEFQFPVMKRTSFGGVSSRRSYMSS